MLDPTCPVPLPAKSKSSLDPLDNAVSRTPDPAALPVIESPVALLAVLFTKRKTGFVPPFGPDSNAVALALVCVIVLLKLCAALNVCAIASPANVLVVAGKLSVTVPRAPVTGDTVIVPLVAFLKATEPTDVPATPKVNAEVPSKVKPAASLTLFVADSNNTRCAVPEVMAVLSIVIPLPAAAQDSVPLPLFVSTPLALAGQPLMPVVGGKPVQFVRVPDAGVPRIGDVKVC